MLARVALLILVLGLWNVFDRVQGQTCTFKSECSQLIQIHFPCGYWGQICFHYILVYYACDKTEPCINSFSRWSACTASCTPGGSRQRTVTCTALPSKETCISTETERCNTQTPCDVNGNWGSWSSWTDSITGCSTTCCVGVVTQTRNRMCNNPPPSGSGTTCPGSASDVRTGSCGSNQNQCPLVCGVGVNFLADTCSRCVRRYYTCVEGSAVETFCSESDGLVWSQQLMACVQPSVCEAVEPAL